MLDINLLTPLNFSPVETHFGEMKRKGSPVNVYLNKYSLVFLNLDCIMSF